MEGASKMSYMLNILNQLGENITITAVTAGDPDKYGDRVDTEAAHTIRAHVQVLTAEDDAVVEGNFNAGDILVFFDKSASYIAKDNIITYRSKEYIMADVILQPDLNSESHYEVIARKT